MSHAVLQPNIAKITGFVTSNRPMGKLALPVAPSALLYSRYKHVRGTATVGQTDGVPLSRLRALDNLIDRLIRLRGNQPIVRSTHELNAEEIDGLTKSYRRGLHRVLTGGAPALGPGGAQNDIGLSLNVVA